MANKKRGTSSKQARDGEAVAVNAIYRPRAEDVSRRVQQMLANQNLSRFAKSCGIAESTLRAYMNGSIPRFDAAVMIAHAAGASLHWLATGEGPMMIAAEAEAGDDDILAPPAGELRHPTVAEGVLRSGQLVDDVLFRARYLRQVLEREPEDDFFLVRVASDAMTPTLEPGDLCLVDARHARPRGSGLYALHMSDSIEVRRLDPRPDGLHLIPDNHAYEAVVLPRERAQELDILGRVVWVGSGV